MDDSSERFADADHVLHGADGARLVSRVMYAVYVTAVLALTYAFTVLRAVLISSDTAWLRHQLGGGRGALLVSGSVFALLVAAWWGGRIRGPATPPLPWIDLVVASSIDRAVAVRPWWTMVLVGTVGCTAVLGGVAGGAVWAAGLSQALAVPIGVLVGALLASAVCFVWLSSAAVHAPPGERPARWRPKVSGLLRSLRLDTLRDHARRTQQLTGAVLSGDPRAARLQVATPITTGRRLQLRPGRAATVSVRRDLLGLRRQPGVAAAGLCLSAVGAWVLSATVLDPSTPLPLTVLGIAFCHAAMGLWSQGLRYAADNLSSPPLFGLPITRRAALHSLVPIGGHLVVALPTAALAWVAHGSDPMQLAILLCALAALAPELVAGHWWATFRASPPPQAFIPETGPLMLVFALARPWLVILVSATLALRRIAASTTPWLSVVLLLIVGIGMLWTGSRMARRLADEGR
ncbi:MAG: hypothetical protein IPM00_18340 [Tetrasphaera sp.]|nr:hypothetical protein [Tetrasphaera sp.]